MSFELYIVIGIRHTPNMQKFFSISLESETSQRVNELYYSRAIYLSVYLYLIIDCVFDFFKFSFDLIILIFDYCLFIYICLFICLLITFFNMPKGLVT